MARGGSQLAGQADLMINPMNKYLTNYRKRLPKQGWIFSPFRMEFRKIPGVSSDFA